MLIFRPLDIFGGWGFRWFNAVLLNFYSVVSIALPRMRHGPLLVVLLHFHTTLCLKLERKLLRLSPRQTK